MELDRDDGYIPCDCSRYREIVYFIIVTLCYVNFTSIHFLKVKLEPIGYWEQEDSRILTDGLEEGI